MKISVNKFELVTKALIQDLSISKRHSERVLVSMNKIMNIDEEIRVRAKTRKIIYDNLWIDLVNKWKGFGKVELVFPLDCDLIGMFEVNEDLDFNLIDNSVVYTSSQFKLDTENILHTRVMTLTGKKKHSDYKITFDPDEIQEVILHSDTKVISVSTLIVESIKDLKR